MAESGCSSPDGCRPSWNVVSIDELKSQAKAAIAIGPFGSRMRSDTYVEHGVPVIRGKNISAGRSFVGEFVFVSDRTADDLKSSNVFPDDLVFPHRGAIGEVGIVPRVGPRRWMLSTSLMKLSVDRRIADPLFLFYFFRSPVGRGELLKRSSNVGTPGIAQPLTSLRSITLALPPLSTQRVIGQVLGAMDNLIENNQRRVVLLEGVAQAIYQEWFVRFRYPGSGDVPLVDSPLGLIPRGWNARRASDALEINPRVQLKRGTQCQQMTMGDLSERTMNCEPSGWKDSPTGSKFENGDTLFARITPCLENGKTGFVQSLAPGEAACGSTEFIVLRGRAVGPAFTYLLARSDDFRGHAISSMSGASGRQRVRNECFDSFLVATPPPALAATFEAKLEPLFHASRALHQQAAALAGLRDYLLPKLVTGQIDASHLDLDMLTGVAVA